MIRLRAELVFLAVVMDRYSRKVIGWALDRRLSTQVAVRALQQALDQRQPPPGVVHHSDQGVQYASSGYAAVLQARPRRWRFIPSRRAGWPTLAIQTVRWAVRL